MSAPDGTPKRRGRVRNHEVAATVLRAVRSARDDLAAQNGVLAEEIRGLRTAMENLTAGVGELAGAATALLAARAPDAGSAEAAPAAVPKGTVKRTGKDA